MAIVNGVCRRLTEEGYVIVKHPGHPRAQHQGYVLEHILTLEQTLGRPITKAMHVHHKDGNKSNNDPSNLVLITPREHQRLHAGWKLIDRAWWKTCARCRRFLCLETDFYKRKPGSHNAYQFHCKQCQCRRRQTPVPGRLPGRPKKKSAVRAERN